ncbi:MAG TPA: GNAT family N-acetyltransferase [Candidatus Paceibacterota bacterium]|nr:GNAT family N-acetyltransferase [Candidatus Paceibacterota bacterium]
MQIRPATAADLPPITRLLALYPDKVLQDHLPEPEEFFVAEDAGAVIACCALEVYSKRLAEVRSLVVAKEFQGKGIATALIERCIERAKELGVYEIITVTGAVSLFEKHGFGIFNNEKYAMVKVLG